VHSIKSLTKHQNHFAARLQEHVSLLVHQPIDQPVEDLDANGVNLIQSMLIYDPVHRISAKDILEHPYFHGFQSGLVRN